MTQGLRRLTSIALFVTACSRSEHVPQPAPSAAPAVQPVPAAPPSSVPVAVPSTVPIADLLFEGDQLETCDEVAVSPERAKAIDSAKAEKGEILRKGETCDQATGAKPWQAVCKRPDGLQSFYYRAAALSGTDKPMRDCLTKGGAWSKNESREAKREAAEQSLARAQRMLQGAK